MKDKTVLILVPETCRRFVSGTIETILGTRIITSTLDNFEHAICGTQLDRVILVDLKVSDLPDSVLNKIIPTMTLESQFIEV